MNDDIDVVCVAPISMFDHRDPAHDNKFDMGVIQCFHYRFEIGLLHSIQRADTTEAGERKRPFSLGESNAAELSIRRPTSRRPVDASATWRPPLAHPQKKLLVPLGIPTGPNGLWASVARLSE